MLLVAVDVRSSESAGGTLCDLAVMVHAATAELARLGAEFDRSGGWSGVGFRSCAHWLSLAAGFDLHTGEELLRVGAALRDLPLCGAAFASGALSFDKARAITRVATSADEDVWLELDRQASGAQLVRICREYATARRFNPGGHADCQLAGRGLWRCWEEDGMLSLTARLPSQEGALVLKALERTGMEMPRCEPEGRRARPAVPDPADDRLAARRADALVALCEQAVGAQAVLMARSASPARASGPRSAGSDALGAGPAGPGAIDPEPTAKPRLPSGWRALPHWWCTSTSGR